jgi:hypothetical protein
MTTGELSSEDDGAPDATMGEPFVGGRHAVQHDDWKSFIGGRGLVSAVLHASALPFPACKGARVHLCARVRTDIGQEDVQAFRHRRWVKIASRSVV